MPAPVTEEVLSGVLAQYALHELRVVAPLEASKRNDNFLAEDAAGRRYVLRCYRRNPRDDRIRFQLRFQQELHERGYPTSEVVRTMAGELFAPSAAGPWALFSYVEGGEYDFASMGQVREAGRRLAQFHTVAADIALEDVPLDINPSVRRWWTRGDEELAALAEMFAGEETEDELAFLRRWRQTLVRDLPLERLDALPQGWVHNDFHGRNMVFVGDELRGLFDFDPLLRDPFAHDVGHALFMFAREFRGSTRLRLDAARTFLEAYDSARTLQDGERAVLPPMLPLVWAPSAPYHALLQRDGEDTLAFFRHYVHLMRDLQAEGERLRPVLSGR